MAIIVNGQARVGVRVAAPSGGGGGGTDADAQAFITAASITDSTQQSAVNTLVTSLKSAGIWTKMKAIYPFVGGTATSHKFNLKDPRDLDAAYRLVFNGGWTHSSTGALPNGTNGYADTKLVPNGLLNQNNTHTSIYSRTNHTPSTYQIDLGSSLLYSDFYLSALYNYTAGYPGAISNINGSGFGGFANNPSYGLFLSQRTSSNSTKIYRNNNLILSHSQPSVTPTLGNLLIGKNANGENSNRELALVTIGDGLTDAESSAFYTAVQAFQTTLGRQV